MVCFDFPEFLPGEPKMGGGHGGGHEPPPPHAQPPDENCKDIANLPDASTIPGSLARLMFAEATDISKIGMGEAQANEMYAVASSVGNRVNYLNEPGLKQSQTLGFGNVGAGIMDVIYSRGKNPNGKSDIQTQYHGFTPNGISGAIQTRIDSALNSGSDSAECFKLLAAIEATNNPGPDPFASQGGTFGLRTGGPHAGLGAPFFQLQNQIAGSGNVFYGLKR